MLLRQCLDARVLSAFLLTLRDTFVHTRTLTEDTVRAPMLTPILARLRGKGRSRFTEQAESNGGKDQPQHFSLCALRRRHLGACEVSGGKQVDHQWKTCGRGKN